MAFENLFIRTKRTLGTATLQVKLDSVIAEGHDNAVTLTKNPVEFGADIVDHAIVEPKILTMQAAITDTPLGAAAFGQLIDSVSNLFGSSTESNATRTQQAYSVLLQLMENREPLTISTKLKTYSNMVLTSMRTVQDKDFSRAIIVDLVFEEVLLTQSQTSALTKDDLASSVANNGAAKVNNGTQQATTPPAAQSQSYLAQLADVVGFGG